MDKYLKAYCCNNLICILATDIFNYAYEDPVIVRIVSNRFPAITRERARRSGRTLLTAPNECEAQLVYFVVSHFLYIQFIRSFLALDLLNVLKYVVI